jgi:urocanate reductase
MRTLIVMGAAAALFAAGAEAAVKTEVGEAQGKHGLVQAEVTFDGNKIQDIKILKESENKILASRVYTDLRQRLIDGGSLNVDTISGATLTSKALIGAVKDAAEKAGVTLAAVPLAGKTSRRTADLPKDFDVLVIGSGGAGFAAAVTAHDKGARVAILEKMPSVGGNSLISGAELAAANNWVQKKLGIKDSVEQHYFDTMKGGDFRGDPAIVRTLVNNALPAAEWLVKTIGVEFEPDNLFQFGGHSVKRSLIPKGATGQEIISKFLVAAEKRHIPIYKETKVTELVRDAAGRVVGVKATMEGQPYEFRAKRGVVLATGGFAANVKMRSEANSFYGEGFKTTNTPAAQGDGIVMAQKAGAKTLNMDLIQTYPMCDPVSGAIELIDDARFEGAVLVNQNGERFVEELDRRDVMSKAILNQPGKYCYALMNQAVEDRSHALRNHGDEVELFTKTGILKSGKTLEEVAKAFDIPVANLRKTVDKVNEFARTGKDTDFHYRGKFSDMSKGPYWIYRGVPSVHHTMGGLKINTKAQVLDTNDRPIPGLYAAGEITGCTHGTNRLGSNAYADIIVFGRIAGGEAAQNK